MTLSQCSKEDLLWVIKRLCQANPGRVQHDLERVLIDLDYEKEKYRINEAEKYNNLADEKRREYIALLKPYEGARFIDIPLEVLEKADKALKEARQADQKYAKLLGLDRNSIKKGGEG